MRSHKTYSRRSSKRRRLKAKTRINPAFRVTFDASGDVGSVRKALKGSGFTKVRVRSRDVVKRKPGAYALFVKAHMPAMLAKGLSTGEAMRQIGLLWREQKAARLNPAFGITYAVTHANPAKRWRRHNPSEKELVSAYRSQHPRSRVVSILRYAKNTGVSKQQECILCGARGPSWSAKWKKTKAAEKWARDHVALHEQNG